MCNTDFELNYQNMVNIIEQLSQGKVCLSCGNDMFIQTGICPFCGKHIINIEYAAKDIDKILLNIKNKPLELNELTIGLYSIRNHFPQIAELLKQNNIEEKINIKLDEINKKLSNEQPLEKNDDIFFRTCLFNNIKPKSELDYINIFRNIIDHNKKNIVSYETFEQITKMFIKDMMIKINNNRIENYNPVCTIYDFEKYHDKNLDGFIQNYFMLKLNNQITKGIYFDNDPLCFITIFHELTHTNQEIEIKLGFFSEEILTYIKDDIMRKLCKTENFDYYYTNYKSITSEKDANINGSEYGIVFLEQDLNIKLNDNVLEYLQDQTNKEKAQKLNTLRNIGTDEQPLNLLFEQYIKNQPQYLEKYPQLTIEYIVKNNTVRKKTQPELLETLEFYHNHPLIVSYIKNNLMSQTETKNTKNT